MPHHGRHHREAQRQSGSSSASDGCGAERMVPSRRRQSMGHLIRSPASCAARWEKRRVHRPVARHPAPGRDAASPIGWRARATRLLPARPRRRRFGAEMSGCRRRRSWRGGVRAHLTCGRGGTGSVAKVALRCIHAHGVCGAAVWRDCADVAWRPSAETLPHAERSGMLAIWTMRTPQRGCATTSHRAIAARRVFGDPWRPTGAVKRANGRGAARAPRQTDGVR